MPTVRAALTAFLVGSCLAIAVPTESADAALTPIVRAGSASVVEGHESKRTIRVPVTLDVPATTTVTVQYSLVGTTATPGLFGDAATAADFKDSTGTITFKAGIVSRFVNVSIYGDTRTEGDETVEVVLHSPTGGAILGDASGIAEILDDENTPGTVVSLGDVTIDEGDNSARSATFALTLSRPAPGTTVTYRIVAGTANGGWSGTGPVPDNADIGDRNGVTKTIVFSTSAVIKPIKVNIAADLSPEPDEVYSVEIVAVTGSATAGRDGIGTIVDADPAGVTAPNFGPSSEPIGSVEPGSTLVGCGQATTRIVVATSIHLDPACTYTRGLEIHASNVTVDCRGAHLVKDFAFNTNHGILIEAPTTTALHDITVRNCIVEDFNNNLRITRTGFKSLAVGSEYVNAYADITIENNSFIDSRNSGVFIDGFVTDITFVDNLVTGAGNVGVYLEAGSKDNVLARNVVTNNGWEDIVNGPVQFDLGGIIIEYLSTGREGIAVDGSRNNAIHDNYVADNAAGGIFLYKNCGENASEPGHWVRNYGATDNIVRHNVIANGPNGIWVGSRASQNQYFMDCSDTPIVDVPGSLQRIYLDPAERNVVEYNHVSGFTNAIRVEADDTIVRGNVIVGGQRGVLVGTKYRTESLSLPVTNVTVTRNTTTGTTAPYEWVWGKGIVTFTSNNANGATGALTAGTPPTLDPFLFVIGFV